MLTFAQSAKPVNPPETKACAAAMRLSCSGPKYALQTYLDAIKAGTSPIDYEISSWRDLEQWFAAHLELQKRYQMTRD
jgi:hypothetical protein